MSISLLRIKMSLCTPGLQKFAYKGLSFTLRSPLYTHSLSQCGLGNLRQSNLLQNITGTYAFTSLFAWDDQCFVDANCIYLWLNKILTYVNNRE